jgi:hypothetical protein
MVRPVEEANTTNPAAERRFDVRVIAGFVIGAILFLIVFMYFGTRLLSSYNDTRGEQSNSTRTQEDDRRAAP